MTHGAVLRDALARVALFENCSKRDLQILSRHMQVVSIPASTVVIREGDVGDAFYVALEGSATVERGGRVVAGIGPGDHVGELALIDPAPRSATVVAQTEMVLGVLDRRSFSAIVRDVPPLNAKLMRSLARRLRERDLDATAQ